MLLSRENYTRPVIKTFKEKDIYVKKMNDEPNTTECKFKYQGPSKLTHLFLPGKSHINTYWIDLYKETFSSLIFEYKSALQMLQLTLLESEVENSREVGRYCQKLEDRFEKIVDNFQKD